MGRFPIDRGREVRVKKDVEIGEKAIFWVFDGVLEIWSKRVDEGEEGFSMFKVPSSSYGVVNEVIPRSKRVREGLEGVLFLFRDTNLSQNNSEGGTHCSSSPLSVEVPIELKVGVVEAEVQKGADSRGGEGRRKDTRSFLKTSDSGVHCSSHVTVCVQGDHIQREVVGKRGRLARSKTVD